MTSVLQNRVIMHVGRFSKSHKRQHILIEVFHLLQKDFPDWKIEFWGGNKQQMKSFRMAGTVSCARTALLPLRRL